MNRHTQSPWKIKRFPNCDNPPFLVDSNDKPLPYSGEEGEANLALCCASPDLLHELRMNKAMLMDLRDKHLYGAAAVIKAFVQKRIEAADAAIAKAEGKQL